MTEKTQTRSPRRSAAGTSRPRKKSGPFVQHAADAMDDPLAEHAEAIEAGPLEDEEIERRIDLARAYGVTLVPEPAAKDYNWMSDFDGSSYTAGDVQTMLARLSPRQVTYGAARVHGFSRKQTCTTYGIGQMSALVWEKAPWYDALLVRERARMFGDANVAFAPMTPLMVAHFAKALEGRYGGEVAQRAAEVVADRVYGKVLQTAKVEVGGFLSAGADTTKFLRDIYEANLALREQHQHMLESSTAPVEDVEWTAEEVEPASAP